MDKNKRIAVVGAGISGLCSAYWLEKIGYDVTVFEKSDHIGGSIVTEKHDDFLVDLGPNSALETSEILKDLIREIGLEDQKIYANQIADKRYVVRNGALHPIPMSPVAFLKTPLFSSAAKLRLLREPFIKPTNGQDISLADFVRYRLGKEFLDYAINPFVAGVYAGDPEDLSTAAAFPKLYALEQNYGSFIKGAIKGRRERKKRGEVAKDRAKLFSFIDGMQTFPETLAGILKKEIVTGVEIEKLNTQNGPFNLALNKNGENFSEQFDQVLLSTPTFSLSKILNSIAPEASESLTQVKYPPVAVVFMAFKASDISRNLDGFGFLVPKVENRQILGSIWSSTIFPGRVPDGHVAFTTFVGGTRQPDNVDLADEQLTGMVVDELNHFVGINNNPVFTRFKRWSRAIPQYTMGYPDIQKMFNQLEEKFPGLYFAGNFRRGIGLGDSVLSAHETVQKIIT